MTAAAEHHAGTGTPLLLLHGFTDTWRAWTPLLGALERHHEVLAPTLPGHHGASPFPSGVSMSVGATADVIARRMDEAGWETAHIAGNSYGGFLALELAARGRARSAVGICAAGGWEHDSREAKAILGYFSRTHQLLKVTGRHNRTLAARPRLRRLALRDLVAHPERVPPRAAADMIEGAAGCGVVVEGIAMARREDAFPELARIHCPVRIAYGTRDRLIRWPRYYGRLRRMLPEAELVALEDCGHLPMWDDPALVARTILDVTLAADEQPLAPAAVER